VLHLDVGENQYRKIHKNSFNHIYHFLKTQLAQRHSTTLPTTKLQMHMDRKNTGKNTAL
jgi:hypothetical protein